MDGSAPDWHGRACCPCCPGGLGKAPSPGALYVEEIRNRSVDKKGYLKSPREIKTAPVRRGRIP